MSASDIEEDRLAGWERRTDWPMTGLAAVFLVVYGWQVLQVGAKPWLRDTLEGALWVIWGVFAADYLIRLTLARRKWRFVWQHLLDLLAVALPMLRQLRVLRLVTVLRVLNRRVSMAVRGRIGIYVAAVTALIGVSAALAVLDAERRNPDANITDFGDAVWWTLTTISTVGYGDRYPTTWEGRVVAAGLMIGGIALLGVITGAIASWFVEQIKGSEQSLERSVQHETEALRAEIVALRAELAAANPDAPALGPSGGTPSSP